MSFTSVFFEIPGTLQIWKKMINSQGISGLLLVRKLQSLLRKPVLVIVMIHFVNSKKLNQGQQQLLFVIFEVPTTVLFTYAMFFIDNVSPVI